MTHSERFAYAPATTSGCPLGGATTQTMKAPTALPMTGDFVATVLSNKIKEVKMRSQRLLTHMWLSLYGNPVTKPLHPAPPSWTFIAAVKSQTWLLCCYDVQNYILVQAWENYGPGAKCGPLSFIILPPNLMKWYGQEVSHTITVFNAFFQCFESFQ